MSAGAYDDVGSSLDHRMTARVPFGIILREMLTLESRGGEPLPIAPLTEVTTIQRELTVIDLVRRDVAAYGPYREVIRPETLGALALLDVCQLIAPPGHALEAFRERFLINTKLDLSGLWERAGQLQATNNVPITVPPMGAIYRSAATGLGRHGGAIVTPVALNAALLVQAGCRAMVEPGERASLSIARIDEGDPVPLRTGQALANRLLVERRTRTPAEVAETRALMQIAAGWLLEAGFGVYARAVMALIDAPHLVLSHRLDGAARTFDA